MTNAVKEQCTPFDVEANPIIANPESPATRSRFAHQFLAVSEGVVQQLDFDRI
jgi:hypothetical protein